MRPVKGAHRSSNHKLQHQNTKTIKEDARTARGGVSEMQSRDSGSPVAVSKHPPPPPTQIGGVGLRWWGGVKYGRGPMSLLFDTKEPKTSEIIPRSSCFWGLAALKGCDADRQAVNWDFLVLSCAPLQVSGCGYRRQTVAPQRLLHLHRLFKYCLALIMKAELLAVWQNTNAGERDERAGNRSAFGLILIFD